MIKDLIDAAVLIDGLSSTNKVDALREVLGALIDAGCITKRDSNVLQQRLAEREALGSTGIGNGVAVPHVKHKSAKRIVMALARSADGLDWQAIDGRRVHTLFMLVAPENASEDHLRVLRWISGLARSADFRRFVQSAEGIAGIRELLHEMSGSA